MAILALFRKRIELVEEQDTLTQPRILKRLLNSLRRLAKIAIDYLLVSNHQKGHGQRRSNRFCQRRFAVPGRPSQKHSTSRLEIVGPKQICALLLFNKLVG